MGLSNGSDLQGSIGWRRAGRIALTALVAASTSPAVAQGSARPKHFVYFLPKTLVLADVSQRLVSCPDEDGRAEIATTIAVISKTVPDARGKVTLDASSGTFAKRTVKLSLNPDGTLQSFNSESEGQGAAVLTAVIKTAVTVAGFGVGIPGFSALGVRADQPRPRPVAQMTCNAKTQKLFKALGQYNQDIAALEARVVLGTAGVADASLLELRRSQRGRILEGLTLKTDSGPIDPLPEHASDAISVKPVDFASWFAVPNDPDGSKLAAALDKAKVVGRGGFLVTVEPAAAMYEALRGSTIALPTTAVPDLIYRRPVPASVAVMPCLATANGCIPDEDGSAVDARTFATVQLPQLSGLFTIPVGRGGLFGTRQATAKFDANGAPIALEYGSGGSSAAVAGLIDTANAGATSLRDAELANLKRQIDLEEARQKLAVLRNPATTE